MKVTTLIASAIALSVASPLALAHKEGDFILRAGAAMVQPKTNSDEITINGTGIGGQTTVQNNTQLGLTLSYMVTDSIGVELLAATPFKHRIGLKGSPAGIAALNGDFADVKHLPPTVSLQYYFMPATSGWQPYVGAGINYTTFFNEKLSDERKAQGFSDLKLSDSWGLALQVGSDFKITDRLVLNAAIWRMDIDTKATARLTNSDLGLNNARVKVDVEVDPWVYMVGLGYKF